MPYRRLPNTDKARVRTLKAAVEMGDARSAFDLAFSQELLGEARSFLFRFEAAHTYYLSCYEQQAKAGRRLQEHAAKARLYVSHFVQVLNLAVIRSEIRLAQKEYYGLPKDNMSVPDLSSESALLEWGRKIIDGERKRVSQGGTPIYTPTIAKVKVLYDIFSESYGLQRNYQSLTAKSLGEVAAMRPVADRLIADIWNQVEKTYEAVTPNERRLALCREYGLIYYYRPNEKKRANTDKQ